MPDTNGDVRVAYFGHDRTDSKVISRIEHLQKLGYKVFGCTFRRLKFNREHEPDWENVDLGQTADYAYVDRLKSLIGGAFRLLSHRKRLKKIDFVVARNIDMALLALFARLISRNRAPIAYEVLDIHRFFLGTRRRHQIFRAIERWVLARTDALIVSSDGYIHNYFEPMQRYGGRWFLLENKVLIGSVEPIDGPPKHRPGKLGRPWVIGWCGTMRCIRSLELLTEIARRHRDTVRIYMRGFPTEISVGEFEATIAAEPNMIYGGGYKGPDDLETIYAEIDLNWTIERWDASYNSKNSDWLLPNRLYEGGCCYVPAIAMAGTETGRRVDKLGIGWVIKEPLVDAVSNLIERLTVRDFETKRDRLKVLPRSTFWEIDDLQQICDQLLALRSPDSEIMVGA